MEFTPTQQRILNILADGMPHRREELVECLEDTLGHRSNIQPHISKLRKKLRPVGQDIVCEVTPSLCYRHVRLLRSSARD